MWIIYIYIKVEKKTGVRLFCDYIIYFPVILYPKGNERRIFFHFFDKVKKNQNISLQEFDFTFFEIIRRQENLSKKKKKDRTLPGQ